MKVAVVEDDEAMNEYIRELLVLEGFDVDVYFLGSKFLKELKKKYYNCIIMDINLRKMSGYNIIKEVKSNPETYGDFNFLILSSRIEQKDINKGLKFGAADYLKKPFDDEELILRVNLLVSRDREIQIDRKKYKEMLFDFKDKKAYYNYEVYQLTNKENKLLKCLVLNAGIIVLKEKLFYEVWGEMHIYGNKSLEVCISRLRSKIPYLKDNLINLKGIGYKLSE